MKRVAFVTPGILPVPAVNGGAVEELITKLVEANEEYREFEIDVFTTANTKLKNYSYDLSRIIEVKKGKWIVFADRVLDICARRFHWKRNVRLYDRAFLREVERGAYDILVIENVTSLYRTLKGRVTCRKCFFHIHNNVDLYRSEADLRNMVKEQFSILAVSDFVKKQVIKAAPGAQCETFYNAVNRRRFAPISKTERVKCRKHWELDGSEMVFLYSGRIVPEKGVLELVSAFCNVYEKNASLSLMIVGKGQFEKEKVSNYERKVYQMAGTCPGIRFTGFIQPEEMRNAYGCADMVIMPTIGGEPFGMVALEAMSMGIPLIATRSGGLVEFLNEEYALLLDVDSKLEKNLEEAMVWGMNHKAQLETMGEAGIAFLDQKKQFNEENYYKEFCRLVDK
ncbi:MAG: glycosyltransferase family 4 protein [Lachnospiraceae bacterium]|jgi:glycosyltransferase involved in cell wall biosynthesis|nr:glycosyltransferase family 4 protein [Lachnospiraceae bacterium]